MLFPDQRLIGLNINHNIIHQNFVCSSNSFSTRCDWRVSHYCSCYFPPKHLVSEDHQQQKRSEIELLLLSFQPLPKLVVYHKHLPTTYLENESILNELEPQWQDLDRRHWEYCNRFLYWYKQNLRIVYTGNMISRQKDTTLNSNIVIFSSRREWTIWAIWWILCSRNFISPLWELNIAYSESQKISFLEN